MGPVPRDHLAIATGGLRGEDREAFIQVLLAQALVPGRAQDEPRSGVTLRSILTSALSTVLALAGMIVPLGGSVPTAAASSAPKVVIIVGPVGGTTTSYRTEAEAAANEARKYTPNVVTIYSPNATWDVVKPALQGASIVINMGHGSGFPSPYSTSLQPVKQDGLGLNPVAGVDDSAVTYWGEQYLATDIHLAPGAIVILGHLCYASGSSEPGKTDPTQAVAQQRVDNFAAGYLAAGAGAVIAEAYGGAAAFYVNALFTAHDTIGNIWANSFSHQGNTFAFPSVRTPGATVQMDPDTASGKYYRALTGNPAISSDAVVGASGGTPPPSPTPDTGGPVPSPTPTPSPTQDGGKGSTSGGMTLTSISAPSVFSPNGDGRQDTFPIRAEFSSPATWQLTITDQTGWIFSTMTGAGGAMDLAWDGTSYGAHLPDGTYTYRLAAPAGLGGALQRTATVRIDTGAPTITPVGAITGPVTFSPNDDGAADSWRSTFKASEPGAVIVTVRSADGTVVRTFASSTSADSTAIVSWDGRSNSGGGVPDGPYVLTVVAADAAGNTSTSLDVPVVVYRSLSRVAAAPAIFYPQDHDTLAPSTKLSFALLQPATVTWRILDGHGRVVATRFQDRVLDPGAQQWAWDGRDAAGRTVAPGAYVSVVTAGNGAASITTRTALTVAAFRIITSPTKPVRGQTMTVTAVSAEPLAGNPRLTIRQPGVAARTVAMVKVAPNTFRVTVRLSSAGAAGTLSRQVSATDAGRRVNVATSTLTLK